MTFLEAFTETTREQLRNVVSYRDGMDWKPGAIAISHAKGVCVDKRVGGWGDREREGWNVTVRHHRKLQMSDGSLVTLAACVQAAVVAIDAVAAGLPVKEYEKLVEPWVMTQVMPWLADARSAMGRQIEYAADGTTKVLIDGEWVTIEQRPTTNGVSPATLGRPYGEAVGDEEPDLGPDDDEDATDAELDVREEKADEAFEQTSEEEENPLGAEFTFTF